MDFHRVVVIEREGHGIFDASGEAFRAVGTFISKANRIVTDNFRLPNGGRIFVVAVEGNLPVYIFGNRVIFAVNRNSAAGNAVGNSADRAALGVGAFFLLFHCVKSYKNVIKRTVSVGHDDFVKRCAVRNKFNISAFRVCNGKRRDLAAVFGFAV